mmetsp:Transcript_24099/g.81371  ORF Transcript_24099/g.81371 Transcript_24099/m.81371 type:complete len:468 (-) Transcript_24099:2788-4191(-)
MCARQPAATAAPAMASPSAADHQPPPEGPAAWRSGWRWAVLGSFSYLSASNAFMCMDFSDDYGLNERLLRSGEADVALLYSLFLLSVVPVMPLAAWGVVRHHWSTVAFGNALNVAGGWLRYLAVVRSSYALAVLSSLVCGGAAAIVVCSFTAVSERWFRPSSRGLATSIAVQSNYLGWALGSLIGADEAGEAERARALFRWQAIAISGCLPLCLFLYRDRHAADQQQPNTLATSTASAAGASASTASTALRSLASNGPFWRRAVPYAAIGGIGFSVPSAQDVLFGSSCYGAGSAWSGFDTGHTTVTNLSFILSGVLCGLCLGAVVPRRSAEAVVLALALLAALSLTALALLSTPHVAPTLPPATLFPLLAGLMALSGIGTIGFIGLALSRAVELADGVPEAYAVGAVEMLVQGFGGGLSALSASCTVGLAGCVAVQWLAVAALAAAYARHLRQRARGVRRYIHRHLS